MELTGEGTTLRYILNYAENNPVSNCASGPYIFIDGDKLIDTSLGNGTHILGHSQHISIWGGTLLGCECAITEEYGKILSEYTHFPSFVLCSTGAEASMRAARIARAYTGRNRVAMFEGCWHGGCDTWLDCEGIPDAVSNLTTRLPYSEKALDIIEKEDFALVIVEPVQNCLPEDNSDFLRKIEKACKKSGAVFCLDETVTGFRLARGGAKELFKLSPDMAVYGKIAGGGLPVGIVGGKREIISVVNHGVVTGGTFSGNPATLSVGLEVLKKLNDGVYGHINRLGEKIRKKVKLQVVGVGSKNRVIFTDKKVKNREERDLFEDKKLIDRFYSHCRKNGIFIGINGIQFLSTAHTEEMVDKIIKVFNSL